MPDIEKEMLPPFLHMSASALRRPALAWIGSWVTLRIGGIIPIFAMEGGFFKSRATQLLLNLAFLWTSEFFEIKPVGVAMANVLRTYRQFGPLIAARLVAHPAGHYILGGWSLGGPVILELAAILGACALPPRALFTFDMRGGQPYVSRRTAVYTTETHAAFLSRGYAVPSQVVRSIAVPCTRLHGSRVDFWTPPPDYIDPNSEDGVDDRRGLYTVGSEHVTLRECDHFTIGMQCAWDIARRLRVR